MIQKHLKFLDLWTENKLKWDAYYTDKTTAKCRQLFPRFMHIFTNIYGYNPNSRRLMYHSTISAIFFATAVLVGTTVYTTLATPMKYTSCISTNVHQHSTTLPSYLLRSVNYLAQDPPLDLQIVNSAFQ